jgi:hypothetical protein
MSKVIYEYKGKEYSFVQDSKIKIGEIWIPVVIYKCEYINPDGEIWVREAEQFSELFKYKKEIYE